MNHIFDQTLIKQLQEGKIAINYGDSKMVDKLDKLNAVMKEAFPYCPSSEGNYSFYCKGTDLWKASHKTHLPPILLDNFIFAPGDILYIGPLIKETIPNAMVIYCENFDDFYHGWDICPQPGTLIRLCVELNNEMRIKITKYVTVTYDGTCQMEKMYLGPIPESDDKNPDFGFVKQLLKNWQSVG